METAKKAVELETSKEEVATEKAETRELMVQLADLDKKRAALTKENGNVVSTRMSMIYSIIGCTWSGRVACLSNKCICMNPEAPYRQRWRHRMPLANQRRFENSDTDSERSIMRPPRALVQFQIILRETL